MEGRKERNLPKLELFTGAMQNVAQDRILCIFLYLFLKLLLHIIRNNTRGNRLRILFCSQLSSVKLENLFSICFWDNSMFENKAVNRKHMELFCSK